LNRLRRSLRAAALVLTSTLCLALPAAAEGQPGALDALERRLVASDGRVVTLDLSGRNQQAVFYLHFGSIWLLDETGAVTGEAHLARSTDHLYLVRDDIILLAGPHLLTGPVAPARHALARFHDHLLSHPLARPLGRLPQGSRFDPGGNVVFPAATAPGPAGSAVWRSTGDHIVITHGDGATETFHRREIGPALKGSDG